MAYSSHALQATLNALGYLEDGQYYKSRDCLNATKDIVRFLRRDDENEKRIRRELLKADTITNDLIPILKSLKPKKDDELFDVVLRLLVNLTQSAIVCYDYKIPTESLIRNVFIEIDNYLQKAKESFADEAFIKIICNKLDTILNKDWQDRPEEDENTIERILYLLRNILFIKTADDNDGANRLITDLNSHDLVIWSLHKGNFFEVIMKMCNSKRESKYSIHLMEIIRLIFRDQKPDELAKVKETNLARRSDGEKEKDNDELLMLQKKDQHMRKHNMARLNPRHSRFVGTYVAMNMKSISNAHNQICHKPARDMVDILDDGNKKISKKPRHRLATEEGETYRKSVPHIRILLMKFATSFLDTCYHNFMTHLYDMVQRKKLEDDEICSYYWIIRFFMEFNRNSSASAQIKIDRIRKTFSLELLHSIEVFIERCIEMQRVEKKEIRTWVRRMHTCVQCYKEYLLTLKSFEKNIKKKNETENEGDALIFAEDTLNEDSCELIISIKNQVFYIQEFRELFINMLKDYDEAKMPKNFLRDLIEANHAFLEMLDAYTKENDEVNVQSKRKKAKRKSTASQKKKKTKSKKQAKKKPTEEELKNELEEREATFEKNSERLGVLLRQEEDLNVQTDPLFPFDFATSDLEFDAQKDKVILRIQEFMSTAKIDDCVALYKEARCLWPKEKLFGGDGVTPEEEYEKIREIYLKHVDEPEEEDSEEKEEEKIDDETQKIDGEEPEEGFEEGDEFGTAADEFGEENDEPRYTVQEEKLDFLQFVARHTHPRILKCYIALMGEFATNTDFQNKCCLRMFERIMHECSLPEYLYQLSLFNLINKMYKDPLRKCMNDNELFNNNSNQTLFEFFRQLLRKFFDALGENPKLILEIGFFKEKRFIVEMVSGKDGGGDLATLLGVSGFRKKTVAASWSDEDDDELRILYETGKSDDAMPGDIIDKIMVRIKNGERKRKDICMALVRLGYYKSMDELKKTHADEPKLGRSRIWRSEDVEDLRSCFEKLMERKAADEPQLDVVDELKTALRIKRYGKDITAKLLELNLVADKSELSNKKRKSGKGKSSKEKNSANFLDANQDLWSKDDNSDDDDDDDDDRRKESSDEDESEDEASGGDDSGSEKESADEAANESEEDELPLSALVPKKKEKLKEKEKMKKKAVVVEDESSNSSVGSSDGVNMSIKKTKRKFDDLFAAESDSDSNESTAKGKKFKISNFVKTSDDNDEEKDDGDKSDAEMKSDDEQEQKEDDGDDMKLVLDANDSEDEDDSAKKKEKVSNELHDGDEEDKENFNEKSKTKKIKKLIVSSDDDEDQVLDQQQQQQQTA